MTKKQKENRMIIAEKVMQFANAHGKEMDMVQALNVVDYIHRYETTLSRINEIECDEYWYKRLWKNGVYPKQERAEERIEKYVRETIGCEVETNRDPRGFAVKLKIKCSENNSFFNVWDGESTGMDW